MRKVLVVDVGGTHIKVLATGVRDPLHLPSGPTLTPKQMVDAVLQATSAWKYDVVSIGYPGVVLRDKVIAEPHNLGRGWVKFDFAGAFGCPVKLLNDAAMQALGAYRGGKMLFLGLGTGLGSTLVIDGIVEPMELGHLPYKKRTFEDYVGLRGLERYGKKKWRAHVFDTVEHLVAALEPDEVVLGGGNVKKLGALPAHCRAGNNDDAFEGGFRLWNKENSNGSSKRANRTPRVEGSAGASQKDPANPSEKVVQGRRKPR